ncbi:MAG: membrane protein insertase YidC, partial [Gammaproteobacteria bacterium]|nr:membrane protein insertase YidC [Gammaproteobacteria bacterium]
SRYWALLAQPQNSPLPASPGLQEPDRPVMIFDSLPESESTHIVFYAGPVDRDLLAANPPLDELLFGALADFFRLLCFGMLFLLDLIYGLAGNYGISIILLSLAVKILISPLTMIADRWQQEVNRTQTRLRPGLDEIKCHHKGEEAHKLTLELYKRHDVSPWYTLKSAAGFLIQIPVFIAAFDMLAENFALSGAAFLWIDDLSRPDALLQLPFTIPFFGDTLNLLPFLMTALSVLAASLQSDVSLSPGLLHEQRRRLYLMSAAFLLLFYTFPAGMVLYWTASNFFHLLKMQLPDRIKRAA